MTQHPEESRNRQNASTNLTTFFEEATFLLLVHKYLLTAETFNLPARRLQKPDISDSYVAITEIIDSFRGKTNEIEKAHKKKIKNKYCDR